ncbi:MAG: hypothetical protein R2752_03065 [Vicinamibacterales bacterium]
MRRPARALLALIAAILGAAGVSGAPRQGRDAQGPCSKAPDANVLVNRDASGACEYFTGITMTDNPASDGRSYTIVLRTEFGRTPDEFGFTFGEGEPDAAGERTGFRLALDRDGQYALMRFRGSRRTMLIDWSRSDAIRLQAENELRVITTRGVIRCFVNGRYVGGYGADVRAGRLGYYLKGAGRLEVPELNVSDGPTLPAGVPWPGRVAVADDLVSARRLQVGGGFVCQTAYDDQGYVVRDVAPRGLCDLPLLTLGTFGSQLRIEVEVLLRAGALNHSFGVFLGRPANGRDPTYVGAIDGQGTFQFARRQGSWQRLTRLLIHPEVRRGLGVWNRLAIDVHGRTLRGVVNGVEVGRADAGADVEGLIGFYVDEPGMAVVFRNLRVLEL